MPEREMQQIKVYVGKDDNIWIEQSSYGNEDSIIIIHPDQVDLLVKWVSDIKKELQQN